MSGGDGGQGALALALGRIQMTGCFSESEEEAVDVVIDALLGLELADRDRRREQRCRACNGRACDEGCGQCDQSPSVAGPNAHRWCSRCSGRGVEPDHDHCPCGCGAHMGCFLYDDGEDPARLKIRRQAMKWKHPDSCPKGNYGMPLDGAVCDCGLDEFRGALRR